jgi:predicted PurR-regulated permease PerM
MDTKPLDQHAKDELRFFRRLPWEKMTTWAIFLLLLYALRDFFDIIIVTFVLSYIGKNVVRRVCRWLGPAGQRHWVRQAVVVLVFLLFVAGVVGLACSLAPTIYRQGQSLVERAEQLAALPASPKNNRASLRANGQPSAADGFAADRAAQAKGASEQPPNPSPGTPDTGNGGTGTEPKGPKNLKELLILRLRSEIGEERYDRWLKDQQIAEQIDLLVNKAGEQLPKITAVAGQWVKRVVTFSLHFLLSVLFSFLIVSDLPKLEHRTIEIPPGRFRDFCREIVPSLLTFSSVMGRAFQAQTLIALCNTVLTYVGLSFLGVESRYFLSVIVFFCSFIPVLGVFVSTVPMSIVALVQQHGGFGLMLEVILMVTLIHLIEAYLLNPLIMGEHFKMNPIVVIVILLVSEHFFGVWGLLLGVPVCYYLFYYAIQGNSEPSIRDSGVWRSLYPEEATKTDTIKAQPVAAVARGS